MAPPTDLPTHITLRIKVPPGHIEGGADEYTLANTVAVTSKIGALREQIQTSLPSNPAPERQRILYAGRALVDNDQTVADALNIRREPSQTEYVVHLLVRGRDGDATAPAPRITTPIGHVAPQHGLAQQYQQHLQTLNQRPAWQQDLENSGQYVDSSFGYPDQVPSHAPQPHHGQHQHGQPHMQNFFAVGPNGERIAVHQQHFAQHIGPNPPHLPPGAHGLPPGVFGMQPLGFQNPPHLPPGAHGLPPGVFGMQPLGFQNPPQQAHPPPAFEELHRAAEQIVVLRNLLNELLNELRAENLLEQATPEQRARIARMEEQARNLSSYLDPFNFARGGNNANQPAALPFPRLSIHQPVDPLRHPHTHHQQAGNENHNPINPPRQRSITQGQAFDPRRHANNGNIAPQVPGQLPTGRLPVPRYTRVSPPSNPEDVTCYLLSDPTGSPQALLLTPQHGAFTGRVANATNTRIPQQPAPALQQAQVALDQARVVRRAPANGEIAAAANPVGFALRHFWLLLRIMIFSYFLLGSNMGWRRPLALGAIALGFWLIRAGMLGDGGVVRGWWEEIVREGAAAVEPVRNANAGQMPTPEEVARRLLEERRRGEGEWIRWGRERVRAVVLLLASLWPGVGEAFVRAREAEDRRLAEEEVAAARRREEERVAAEEAERTEREKREGEAVETEQSATGEQAATKDQAATGEQAPTAESSTGEQAAVTEQGSDAAPSASTSG